MFDPVNADLNRHLASQEVLESAWESIDTERSELNDVDDRLKALIAMDDAQWNDTLDAELSKLYDRRDELHRIIENAMGYSIEWPHLY